MIDQKTFVEILAAAGSWAIGYFTTLVIGQGMSAVSAYAVIVGWWLTAYVSSSFALRVSVAIPLAAGYLALFLIATISGQSWFYRDTEFLSVSAALGIGLAQTLVVCSPIVFNWLFRQAIRICSKKR